MIWVLLALLIGGCDSFSGEGPPFATPPEFCAALEAEPALLELDGEELVLTCLSDDRALMERCEDESGQLTVPQGAVDAICRRCSDAGWTCIHFQHPCSGFPTTTVDEYLCGVL